MIVKISKDTKKELEKLDVGAVYLFGSEIQGISGPESDIDIGVVFTSAEPVLKKRLRVYEELYSIFSDIYSYKEVDIVFLQDAHLDVQLNVITHGIILYQISAQFGADYKEKVMLSYMDFEPMLREFDRMTLERIG